MGGMRAVALVAAVATALAWFQLDGLPGTVRAWSAVLLVPLPFLMVLQARILASTGQEVPRQAAYVSSAVSLWLLALVTAAAAYAGGWGWQELGLAPAAPRLALILTGMATVSGVAILFAFRLAGVRETSTLRELLPSTSSERVLFIAVASSAGICEEIVFRGFLLHALTQATGSVALAVVVSSGAFGVLHAYQRPAGVLRAALLGAVLAGTVVLSTSVYPAIIAHTAINLLSGLWLARYLIR